MLRDQVDLSIIVVSYNVRELLLNCLESIFTFVKGISFEIIVIDNASNDGTVNALRDQFPSVRSITNSSNIGFARANNQGFRISRGHFILMLNPDIKIINDSISKMVDILRENDSIGILGCKLVNPDGSFQCAGFKFPTFWQLAKTSIINLSFSPKEKHRSSLVRVDWVLGACIMFNKRILDDIGYLDENYFMYGEEKDFCFRTKKKGYQVYCYVGGKVIHYGNQSARKVQSSSFLEFHKSQNRFFAKHYAHPYANLCKLMLFLGVLLRLAFWSFLNLFIKSGNARSKKQMYHHAFQWYLPLKEQ